MTSKTVTGIISDKMATVKYLISVFWGLNANCIPNIVKAMATKKIQLIEQLDVEQIPPQF